MRRNGARPVWSGGKDRGVKTRVLPITIAQGIEAPGGPVAHPGDKPGEHGRAIKSGVRILPTCFYMITK